MNDFDRQDEIEREIERTRERMTRNIDALGNRLSPQNLKAQAKDAITEKAQRTGSRIVELVRRNPLPFAAVGLGAIWLLARGRRGKGRAVAAQLRRSNRGHPMAATIASAVIGTAVRTLLTETIRRPRAVREIRDRLANRVHHTADRVKETAAEAGRALQEAGREHA